MIKRLEKASVAPHLTASCLNDISQILSKNISTSRQRDCSVSNQKLQKLELFFHKID